MARTQADLFDIAAKCELASQNAADDDQRLSLKELRDLWTALANESPNLSEERLAEEVAARGRRREGRSGAVCVGGPDSRRFPAGHRNCWRPPLEALFEQQFGRLGRVSCLLHYKF